MSIDHFFSRNVKIECVLFHSINKICFCYTKKVGLTSKQPIFFIWMHLKMQDSIVIMHQLHLINCSIDFLHSFAILQSVFYAIPNTNYYFALQYVQPCLYNQRQASSMCSFCQSTRSQSVCLRVRCLTC